MTDFRPDPPRQATTTNTKVAAGAGALAMAIAVTTPVIMSLEGFRSVGYSDVVGVSTSCYGHTGPDAIVGRRYTASECQTQLAKDVRKHAEEIATCIHVPLPTKTFAAFISFGYNVGSAGFCRSSIARKINAHDLRGACAGLSAWVYAGKPPRVIPGLANRRAKERALCEAGLK